MRNAAVLFVAVLVASALAPATVAANGADECEFPVERVDATGIEVRVDAEPERVVTLNPSAAQTMWEIGAREKVVGATKHASNLQGFAEVTNVSGAGQTINNEEVVGLEPDLVLAPHVIDNETVRTLREAGLTIYRFHEAESIADIEAKTRLVGRMTGECDGAAETIDWMEERLSVVDAAVADADRPDVLYVFYDYTPGQNTFIHTIIERAGGENVAARAGIEGYQKVNQETLVQEDPEWIVLNDDWDEVPATPGYNSTTAVREDQIVVVDTNHLNRPGPRVVHAVTTLAKAFHPEAYAAANATAAEETTDDESADTPETTADADDEVERAESNPDDGTDGADGPGFGVPVALLAVLTAALLRIGDRR